MGKRISYIDLAKGACMLLVILHHIDGPLDNYHIERIIMCFTMPLFFFLSGFFFKSYNGFTDFILRKINKLIIPFVFFSFITSLLFSIGWFLVGKLGKILQIPQNEIIALQNDDLFLNTPLWFLMSLFETSFMFYLIHLFCNKLNIKDTYRKLVMLIICLMIGIIGYQLGAHRINIPLWIDTSMNAIPFYFFGYLFKEKMGFLAQYKFDKYTPAILVVLGFIVYSQANFVNMRMNVYSGSIFSFYLCAMSGSFFILLLSKLINRVSIILFIGRYSVIILGTHLSLLWILKRLLVNYITNDWLLSLMLFILLIIISIPVCIIFTRLFPKFVGQEDLFKLE